MRAVIQRTLKYASIEVDGLLVGAIDKGLVIYLGIEATDTLIDIEWLGRKMTNLRIFSDENEKMNLSLADIKGAGMLIISQFTLFASTKKGNRPSYIKSAPPEIAKKIYDMFLEHMTNSYNHPISQGVFGADMHVTYTNDGPVTIIIDTNNKE